MSEAGPSSSSSSSARLSGLSALWLTHFDDIKGQTVLFYESSGVPQEGIEHASLPSGLHLLERDLVCFRHHDHPAVGVFRSRQVEGGRGRQMGTLGVILTQEASVEDVFGLQGELDALLDELEGLGTPLARVEEGEGVWKRLTEVWSVGRANTGSTRDGAGGSRTAEVDRVRRLVDGRITVDSSHPITYLPALLSMLGPQIVPLYKAALTSKRILIYSPPPLLPLAAFAWCIWAMSLPPSSLHLCDPAGESDHGADPSSGSMSWLGNVGLMDLSDLKRRSGGWVATTSDAIFRTHRTYDLFLDLSVSPPAVHAPPTPPSGSSSSSMSGHHISYALSDLPLYRSLLLLDSSPPGITILPTADGLGEGEGEDDLDAPTHPHAHAHAHAHGKEVRKGAYRRIKENRSIYTRQGGWWLLAFDLFNRAWALCVGVCEYATGRGRVGEIRLGEGEEDASLLPSDLASRGVGTFTDEDDEGTEDVGDGDKVEDEAVRRGRLILRQLHHHSYHLLARLRQIAGPQDKREGKEVLSEKEVKELVGGKIWGGAGEARFWQELAVAWGWARA